MTSDPSRHRHDEYFPRTEFDDAAARLVAAIGSRGEETIAAADYRVVVSTLAIFAQRFGLSREEAAEIAAETVAETFLRTAAHERQVAQPAAYLFWTTRNRVIDRRRRVRVREHTETPVDDVERVSRNRYFSTEDDTITRLLDRHASAELVQDALRAASAAGEHLLVRIVTTWLNVAAELGRAPSSREVAPRAEVSHTSVNQALRRLRDYMPSESLQTL
jgi:DNA-directed RNA polymerase specialized sigma24 family protein